MRWQVGGVRGAGRGMGLPLAAAILCLLPLYTSSTGDIRHHGTSRTRGWRGGVQPTTDVTANNSVSNITAQLGGTAYLHCLVGHLSERGQVSWIRKRDWHILSSGKFTYTNDERFQVLHGEGSEDWTLQIKFVQKRDNGTYECQVSTRTGIVSHYVRLQIVVPEAFILGSGEHHVDMGSVIHLICIVEKSPTPPQYVFWYHNDRMINYDATRGGITVETEPGARTQSRLTVRGATLKDSGNYTCSASNTEPASIHVFVSEGKGTDMYVLHDDRMINCDATRSGITVETEPGARTQSRLTVRGAKLKDSGNYTCSASNTEPASIHVFVSEGSNKMAAILRRNTSAIHGITSSVTCLLLLFSVLIHFGLR